MVRVILTVLVSWLGLAVPVALFVAALGRSALREDLALRPVPAPPGPPDAPDPTRSPPAREALATGRQHLLP